MRAITALYPPSLARITRLGLLLAVVSFKPVPAAAGGGFVLVTEWGEWGGSGVARIDPSTDQIAARVALDGSPRHIAADPGRRLAYVSLHYGDRITALKADTLEAADLVIPGLGKAPIGVTLTPDGRKLLVATRGSDGVISGDDRLDVVALDPDTWPPGASLITSIATGLHPIQAILDHTGRYAVVTVRNQPAILVVNLSTHQVVWQAPNLPINAEPEGGDAHPTQNVVYVTLHGVSTLEVIDLDLMAVTRHVPILNSTGSPTQPSAVRFTPDGSRAFVSGQTVDRVLMFDTSDPRNPVQAPGVELPTGPQPHDIVWLPGDRAYVADTNNMQPHGSLSILENVSGAPAAAGPILTDLAGPLSFAYFEEAPAAPPTYLTEGLETWVAAPDGNLLYTRIVRPVPSLYPGLRFPALIAIPGGTGPGAPLADSPGYLSLAADGFVVIAFNPEGRGAGTPGNLLSQGSENCNGFVHQDDLKAVIEHAAGLPYVNARNIGVETASFGIAIGAGALGRYPDLKVAYLVDQEGPHDSRVITFYDAGRETAVCGHLSTLTDPSPENLAFWAEREAVRHIGGYPGLYLRMQAQVDHAQGPGYFRHTLEMISAAGRANAGGTGSSRWTRVNGADLGNPINVTYALDQPARYPLWVPGRLSDHPGLNLEYDREMSALSAAGDFNADGEVEWGDTAGFEACFTGAAGGPVLPECAPGDFDADGDVDCVDYDQLRLAWTGSGTAPPLAGCGLTPPPVAGLLLSVTAGNPSLLRLDWNPAPSAVRYSVTSDLSPGGTFASPVATDVATTSVQVPLPPGQLLYFKVAGANADGMEGPR